MESHCGQDRCALAPLGAVASLIAAFVGCADQSMLPVPKDAAPPAPAPDSSIDPGHPDASLETVADASTDGTSKEASSLSLDPRSGSRLKAIWFDAPGGATVFQGWYDTQLDQRCGFSRAADGKLHCLPVLVFEGSRVKCSGSRCITDFATTPYGKVDVLTVCPGHQVIYRRGAAVSVAGIPDAHEVTEVAPEEFVGAQVRAGGPDPSPSPLMLEADDGATTLWGWRDDRNQAECTFEDLAGYAGSSLSGELHCIPRWQGYASGSYGPFADAACQGPAAEVGIDRACSARFVWSSGSVCASARLTIFGLGKPIERAFTKSGSACQAIEARATTRYFEVGAPLSLTDLPSAAAARTGTARIRTVTFETAGRMVRHALWDESLGAVCEPRDTEAGTVCLPRVDARGLGFLLFADAACTQPLVEVRPPCQQPRLYGDAAFPLQIRRVGERYLGPIFSHGGPDHRCAPASAVSETDLFRLGPVLDPAAFASLTRTLR